MKSIEIDRHRSDVLLDRSNHSRSVPVLMELEVRPVDSEMTTVVRIMDLADDVVFQLDDAGYNNPWVYVRRTLVPDETVLFEDGFELLFVTRVPQEVSAHHMMTFLTCWANLLLVYPEMILAIKSSVWLIASNRKLYLASLTLGVNRS